MNNFTNWFVYKLHNINPQTDGENLVIRYGLELILDNVCKVIGILIFGLLIGRVEDFFLALFVFGSIRANIGGLHAKTKWGCMFCMMGVCIISSVAKIIYISDFCLFITFVCVVLIIMRFAPKTVNVNLFAPETIIKKKSYGIMLISVYILLAYLNIDFRTLIMTPILLEILTLLPNERR